MINVKHLTKIYDKNENEVKALDDVSFFLPDKGLVFIVGKSGSGKSTLLNMLGGLDDSSSGDIYINNLNVTKMSDSELDAYRNLYVGIVYQNYNLFENETVLENILNATYIARLSITTEEIESILKDLDLDGIKDKLVKNLSGGQKQRVAIARALIKNPTLLLADEPTGNLDSKTATLIFDLLKKISLSRLVVIISHDNQAANDYADRLIRLSDGHIIEDVVRYKRETSSDKTNILIDETDDINQSTIDEINSHLKDTTYHIRKKQKEFKPYINSDEKEINEYVKLKRPRINPLHVLKSGRKIIKNNLASFIVSTFLAVFMIGLLSLSTFFMAFDGSAAINDAVNITNAKAMVLRKGYSFTNNVSQINKDYLIECEEADVLQIKASGYSGNYYPIVNSGLAIESYYPDSGLSLSDISYKTIYPTAALGTVVCDMNHLYYLFGNNFSLAAGSLYGLEESHKVIITDYVADALLFYNSSYASNDSNDPYQKIMNTTIKYRYTVGAIIKTDYKTQYKIYLDALEKMKKEPQNASEIAKSISRSEGFNNFTDDLEARLNYAYSINPNYRKALLASLDFAYFNNSFYSENEGASPNELIPLSTHLSKRAKVDEELVGDEVLFSTKIFNEMFGTSYVGSGPEDFVSKTIYIHNYGMEQSTSGASKYISKIIIKGLKETSDTNLFFCSKEKQEELGEYQLYTYGYSFTNVKKSYDIFMALKPYFFYTTIHSFEAVFNTINIVGIFSEVFTVVMFVLLGILALIIMMHSLRMIKHEQYRFGVYKALGYSSRYLTLSVLITNIVMVVAIIICSTLFTYGISFLVNYVLQQGFYYYTNNTIYFYITLLSFKLDYTMYFNLAALVLTFIFSFVPLIAIRKIKPNKIIRNAE